MIIVGFVGHFYQWVVRNYRRPRRLRAHLGFSPAFSIRDSISWSAQEHCPAQQVAGGVIANSLSFELRTSVISRKVRPSLSRTAARPVNSSHRSTVVSTYLGSSSISLAWRPVFSHAIRVEPEPPKGSSSTSLRLLLLTMARSISSTGFCVG